MSTPHSRLLSLLRNSSRASHLLQVHAQLVARALDDFPFSNSLLYAACRLSSSCRSSQIAAGYPQLLFSRIPRPDTFSWNTIIRFHSQASDPHGAVHLFARMRRLGVPSDAYTYPFVLKACALLPGGKQGLMVHGDIVKRGLTEDSFVVNGLIAFYCKNADVVSGRRLFEGFESRDLVSWNSLIAGYVSCGEMSEAQKLFDAMPERDAFSWAILIDGYGKKMGDVGRARQLFDGMTVADLVCWNSMIDGYVKLAMMSPARELFEAMPHRNVITWSILIDGYVRHGDPKEAFDLFRQMLRQGIKPDVVSAVGAISACAQLGALDQGRWVHSFLKKSKISLDVVVETALVDMYMKCGELSVARLLFKNMKSRSVVTWNVMIVGLGSNGHGLEAAELFYQMEKEGAPMDDLTFIAVLAACAHAGLVSEGREIFERMRPDFRIEPKAEHYSCMVDLLGRAGHLHEARNVIENMPIEPTPDLWGSILAACRTHRRVDLAVVAVERLKNLGADDGGVYVLLSNIYAEEGMWEDACRVRKLISERGMKKETGSSAVEVDGCVHEFVNGDISHPLREEVHSVLHSLSKVMPVKT